VPVGNFPHLVLEGQRDSGVNALVLYGDDLET